MKKIMFLAVLICSPTSFADFDSNDISRVANGNLTEMLKISKGGSYCLTRSMPPADMPPTSNLSAVEVSFVDGTKALMIPLKIGEEVCDKSMSPTCTFELTMLYQKKSENGGRELIVTKRTLQTQSSLLSSGSKPRSYWHAPQNQKIEIKSTKRVSPDKFFDDAGIMSSCRLPALAKHDLLKPLLDNIGKPDPGMYDRSVTDVDSPPAVR